MYQAFYAVLQLDEGPVRHYVDHLSVNLGPDGVLLLHLHPGAVRLLFEAQGDLFFLLIYVKYPHLYLLAYRDYL